MKCPKFEAGVGEKLQRCSVKGIAADEEELSPPPSQEGGDEMHRSGVDTPDAENGDRRKWYEVVEHTASQVEDGRIDCGAVEEVVDELETVVEVEELVCVVAGVGVVGVSVVAGV